MDEAVLLPMPMGGLIDAHESETESGHDLFPIQLHDSASRPYTQMVVTVLSHAVLSKEHFFLEEEELPRYIATTPSGKDYLNGIFGITKIAPGTYKIQSEHRLPSEQIATFFGADCIVECTKVWGGANGGAAPDYQGLGAKTQFLIYDGATGLEGYTNAGALYYPSAMEQSSMSSMEASAIGARAVAKLIAKRVGIVKPEVPELHDEL